MSDPYRDVETLCIKCWTEEHPGELFPVDANIAECLRHYLEGYAPLRYRRKRSDLDEKF